jgi:hypothetical protein
VVIIIFASSFFYAVFWRIFTNSAMDWDREGHLDVYNGYSTFYEYYFVEDKNFEDHYGLISSEEAYEQMVKYSYYALTTLSTVGFGDFGPKAVYEKQLMTGVLLFGVTIFALVMNNLMTVLKNYKQIGLI